jgi:very-short-patch-repair endonuclease
MFGRIPPIHNRKSKKEQRQKLRKSGTVVEAVLWKSLQRRQIDGKKFSRQHSIGPYIVDFYCAECHLIVELDGQRHFEFIADEYEGERTRYLEQEGLRIIRFENRLIFEALESVLEAIRQELLA